jgi:hypothetical protein
MNIDGAIASNQTLGIVLDAVLIGIWSRNRSFVRELTIDPDRAWRVIPRVAASSVAVLIGWISLFDNWRQLTAIPFRATRHFPSQRVQIDPPGDEVRAITYSILAATLLLTACLIARHMGGYLLQLLLAAGAVVAWLPFFVLQQRFTINLAMGFDGSWTSPADIAAYLAFVVLSWAFDIGLIAVSFLFLAALTAIPVTLLLDLLRLRHPRITAEAQPFFNAIGGRTSQ